MDAKKVMEVFGTLRELPKTVERAQELKDALDDAVLCIRELLDHFREVAEKVERVEAMLAKLKGGRND